ncbi:MAG: hypothetical protein U9N60_00140 [Thermodesulfobacteriota bacterium]|nr:hypothetical protein [Thermodesulfobacteriota bacterium]
MIMAIRTYDIPVFFAILAIVGLAWRSYGERQNIDEIRRERQRQVVAGLFDIAATNLKRDTFRHFGSMAIPKSSKN